MNATLPTPAPRTTPLVTNPADARNRIANAVSCPAPRQVTRFRTANGSPVSASAAPASTLIG
ncbi:hypothetical protein [Actinomadura madurae]|uniref:hypothetical protein n=1 Tax=Actinomadura madurae TaxID=1993 RepID=UPI0020D21AEB|nr:hypothetical protein [Actinomadura madurae]MCQ0019399.1 hypothetical protein [Actinomadura madurae]